MSSIFFCWIYLGIGKRETVVDESNSSEQEINAYERDLKDDTDDLRRAIAGEDTE